MAQHSISAVVLGGALILATMVPAVAATCPAADPPKVRVVSDLPPPNIRHALTRPRIGALGGNGHMTSDRRHAGLTQAKTHFTVRPTLAFAKLSDGTICAQVRDVEAKWEMTTLQVDVAVEYGKGSCPYTEILRHENEHVAIAQRNFRAAEQSLKRDLAALAARVRPFAVSRDGTQRAAKDMAERFMAAAEPALEKYRSDTRRANAAIDTPESYRAVSARCKDW